MILSEEYVLRALEMRVKTTRVVGTLCKIKDPELLHSAMLYFDIWNDGIYISHPFVTISQDIADNMTRDIFRIFIEYIHHWMPPFTFDEIRIIIIASKKYGYIVTRHKDRLSFRRDPL